MLDYESGVGRHRRKEGNEVLSHPHNRHGEVISALVRGAGPDRRGDQTFQEGAKGNLNVEYDGPVKGEGRKRREKETTAIGKNQLHSRVKEPGSGP